MTPLEKYPDGVCFTIGDSAELNAKLLDLIRSGKKPGQLRRARRL